MGDTESRDQLFPLTCHEYMLELSDLDTHDGYTWKHDYTSIRYMLGKKVS